MGRRTRSTARDHGAPPRAPPEGPVPLDSHPAAARAPGGLPPASRPMRPSRFASRADRPRRRHLRRLRGADPARPAEPADGRIQRPVGATVWWPMEWGVGWTSTSDTAAKGPSARGRPARAPPSGAGVSPVNRHPQADRASPSRSTCPLLPVAPASVPGSRPQADRGVIPSERSDEGSWRAVASVWPL